MSNPRRKAPATTRRQIVEALRDPGRRFLDQKSSSRNYLDHWDLKAAGFYADLANGLAVSDDLYLKPKNHSNDRSVTNACWPIPKTMPTRRSTSM